MLNEEQPLPLAFGVKARSPLRPSPQIPHTIVNRWQTLVNLMAELVGVPAGLVMQIVDHEIQVLVASKTEGNPYHPGDAEQLAGSGLYCETVLKDKSELLVSNALVDDHWRNNPDVKLNMISYLGFPIHWPDQSPFGTICVLDRKDNSYSDIYKRLIAQFRDTIESQLELIYHDACSRETQSQLATLIDNLPNGAIYQTVIAPDGQISFPYMSAGILALTGVSSSEVMQDPLALRSTIHEDDLPLLQQAEQHSLQTGTSLDCQFRHRTPDGRLTWVHCRSAPRSRSDGSTAWDGVVVDVTAQKLEQERERLLERANNNLNIVEKLARIGTWSWDVAKDHLVWSEMLYEINRWSLSKPPPQFHELQEILKPESLAAFDAAAANCLKTGESFNLELEHLEVDGKPVFVIAAGQACRDLDGNIVSLFGTVQDISERKQMERQLAARERWLSEMVENLPLGAIFVTGEQVCINRTVEEITGYARYELATRDNWFRLLWQEMYDQLMPIYLEDQKNGLDRVAQVPFYRKDGALRMGEFVASLVGEEEIWLMRDITEIQKSEEDLRLAERALRDRDREFAERELDESEQRFRLLLEYAGDAYFLHDEEGRIFEANRQACESLGYTHVELLGLTVNDLVTDIDYQELLRLWAATAPGQSVTVSSHVHRRKDGTTVPVEARVTCYAIHGQKLFLAAVRDISERVDAAAALGESEERFRLLVEHAGDDFFVHDDEGQFLDVNRHSCESLGYSREELLEMSVLQLAPSIRSLTEVEAIWNAMMPGTAATLYSEHVRKDGTAIPTEIRLTCYFLQGRKVFLALARDITERVETERAIQQLNADLEERVIHRTEALLRAEARWQFALDGSGDGVWDWNVPSGEVFYSHQWKAMLGYADNEVGHTTQDWSDRVHPDDIPGCWETIENHFRGDTPVFVLEHRMQTKSGSWRWILDRGKLVERAEDGSPFRVIGTHTDITDRKEAENRIRELSERIQLAVKAGGVGIWELDFAEARFIWNEQMHVLYGMKQGDFHGSLEQWVTILHPDDRESISRAWELAVSATSIFEAEFRIVQPSGAVRHIRGLAQVIRGSDNSPLRALGTNWDVTEQWLLNEDLKHAKRQADTANRAKSEFLANMSHEIRTPMNGILGMAELALDTELSSEQWEFIQTIQSSADSLLTIINDILDFSKIEAGKLDVDPFDFRLRESLKDMLKPLTMRAHKKGLELTCDVGLDVRDALHCDWNRLRQILINLVGNAIKFTEHGKISVQVQTQKSKQQIPGLKAILLHFVVSDTGIGIPADKLSKIFAPFEQAEGTTNRRFGGTGLGLSISARLVEMLGGEIWVESQPGQGSKFHFTVALDIAREPVSPAMWLRPDALRETTVLIVDDNVSDRENLKSLVNGWGMRATCLEREGNVLQKMISSAQAGEPFSVLLLDATESELSGLNLVAKIRSHPVLADIAVLILSSAEAPENVRHYQELGVVAYLVKPVSSSELQGAIQRGLHPAVSRKTEANRSGILATANVHSEVRPLKILLVEDNVVNQRVGQLLLQKHGHLVQIAQNGREAIERIADEVFDLVLMDVQMPEMDGLEATAAIRAAEQETKTHLPIIALTAYAMTGDRERFLAAGMDGYVTKPLHPEDLWTTFRQVLPTVAISSPQTPRSSVPFSKPRGAVFDRAKALAHSGGDLSILRETTDLFREHVGGYLAQIRQGIDAGDAQAVQQVAHTLRGSVRFYGADIAADLTFQLEGCGLTGNLTQGLELWSRLKREIQRLLEALAAEGW
ncbi:MAG: PAS domain S-box protein [Planctomycetota bacterium]